MLARVPDAGSEGRFAEAPSSAWAVLPGWSGPPELLARIAQAALEAIEELETDAPQCNISVTVPVTYDGRTGEDVERFDSPQGFIEKVTADALRKFTSVHMRIVGRNARLDVRVIRERGLRFARILEFLLGRRPTEGIFLTVASTDPHARDVKDVRDRVLGAIGRGHSKWRHAGISSGGTNPFGAEWQQRRGEDPRFALFVKALIGYLVVLAILERFGFSLVDGTYLALATAVVVGSVCSAAAFCCYPLSRCRRRRELGEPVAPQSDSGFSSLGLSSASYLSMSGTLICKSLRPRSPPGQSHASMPTSRRRPRYPCLTRSEARP
jgi:hypothetical protein